MRPFIGRWIRFSSIFPHLCRLIQHYQGTLFTFCQSDCRLAYKNNEFHGFRLDLYLQLNFESDKGRIVFAGDSLIEYFPFSELYHGEKIIYNRGIAGSTTYDVLSRADTLILPLQPSKLFLLVGTNDFMLQPKNNNEKSIASVYKGLQ